MGPSRLCGAACASMSLPGQATRMGKGRQPRNATSRKEAPQEETGPDLAAMFHEGDHNIERKRTDNLFRQLDERQLTEDEQRIIDQRVELQRKLFQEFEKRERQRKIQELQDVCPDLTKETAEHALTMCNWKEEEAAVRFTSDPWFRRRVLAASSMTAVQAAKAAIAAAAAAGAPAPAPKPKRGAGLSFPRPRLVDAAALQQGHVFVGAFRGRLGPTQMAMQAQRLVDMGIITCRNAPARNSSSAAASQQDKPSEGMPEDDTTQPLNPTIPTSGSSTPMPPLPAAGGASGPEAGTAELHDCDTPGEVSGAAGIGSPPASGGGGGGAAPSAAQAALSVLAALGSAQQGEGDGEAPSLTEELEDFEWGPQGIVYSCQEGQEVVRVCLDDALLNALVNKAVNEAAADSTLDESGGSLLEEVPESVAACAPTQVQCGTGGSLEQPSATSLGLAGVPTVSGSLGAAGRRGTRKRSRSPELCDAGPQTARARTSQSAELQDTTATCSDTETEDWEGGGGALQADCPAHAHNQQPPVHCLQPPATTTGTDATDALDPAAFEQLQQQLQSQLQQLQQVPQLVPHQQQPDPVAGGRGRGRGRKAAKAQSSAQSDGTVGPAPDLALPPVSAASRRGSGTAKSSVAISARGHTNRGRVKQKGAKRAELVAVGQLRVEAGWYNAGYIFPDGFISRTIFRSSVELAAVCVHECRVVGEGGTYWPLPTFQVTAMDRPSEPVFAKSCTGCWSQVLKRINREIETRRAAGEDLPPAPKTAIAGPEYFGFNQPEVVAAVEALDAQHQCIEYWVGKEDRTAMIEGGHMLSAQVMGPVTAGRGGGAAGGRGGRGGRGGGRGGAGGAGGYQQEVVEDATDDCYVGSRWGAIDRAQRYRKRCAADGGDSATGAGGLAGGAGGGGSGGVGADDDENPLPGFIDPVTLEVVVNPAISPYGHVMGMATWRAVLAEQKRCPFTKAPLGPEQLVALTRNNIDRYRDRIIQQ